ncbi:transcriptional regulator [Paenibacillus athensensis]|uniref:ArsR family transcriptional regulator n=1 Tax=Paenibacillus athensensis TaxID=1967502 RepID=A0A4Y8QAL7_9BACL|nr:metalloregulator ArsR/SmtB family transcription factor [Paenibacillus athensensis]MCD1258993.1 transcriptional regulator [Paenibacillus athensensis]
MNREPETSTRKVILTMLKTQGPLSVHEMSRQLDITEMAVRRHIHSLERDGLLETQLVRQAMGRPSSLYSLAAAADELFPKNYHQLSLDLLDELLEHEGEELVGQLFERRKEKLRARYEPRMSGKSLAERVAELASIQNENGYMAEWSPSGEGAFTLSEHNCPITQVAGAYQQACACELALFRKLLGAEVERSECLAKGGSKCVYHIREDQ